jgi:glycosyltransferase involved in cell wall biosynthesis
VTEYYAEHAARHFNLPSRRIHSVPMGILVEDFPSASPEPDSPFTIGYLARICPEKGLAVVCEAFALLRQAGRDCRLRAAGYLGPADKPYFGELQSALRRHGLEGEFDYVGEVDMPRKVAFLQSCHVLSVPAIYNEAKGFYLLEAMSCGVPVAQPGRGAFPEIVEATGGGLLYDPPTPQRLADAIGKLMDDPSLRRRLGEQGSTAVRRLYTADIMARRTWALYEDYCSAARP